MASAYYIKLFHELLDDAKMGRLPDNLWRRFIECLLMAGELQEGGFLPSLSDMVWRLHLESEDVLERELLRLKDVGILDVRPYTPNNPLNLRWIVVNFAKRQTAISDAERKRQSRKRQADTNGGMVDHSDHSNTNNTKEKDIYIEGVVTQSVTNRDNIVTSLPFRTKAVHPEPVNQMIMAIQPCVKTALTGKTEEDFVDAAYSFIGWGVQLSELSGFSKWWATNGYYSGTPSLKSFTDEFRNYLRSTQAVDINSVKDADGGMYG